MHSHPVALDQCRRLMASLPHVSAVAAPTTADAAESVAKLGDPTVLAIASERAAQLYGLEIIGENVGDHPEAYTRFVSVAPYTRIDRGSGHVAHGVLVRDGSRARRAVSRARAFSRHNVDLVQLVSRPIPHSTWRYRFDAVLGGHPLDSEIATALTELRGLTRELRVFGSYPRPCYEMKNVTVTEAVMSCLPASIGVASARNAASAA